MLAQNWQGGSLHVQPDFMKFKKVVIFLVKLRLLRNQEFHRKEHSKAFQALRERRKKTERKRNVKE